jgi:hypothetical protein
MVNNVFGFAMVLLAEELERRERMRGGRLKGTNGGNG